MLRAQDTNARQALEDATAAPRITLSGSATAGEVTLLVADNGPGIAPTARARIFDPFYTTKLAGSGTGLGLSYSLSIIEAHGGRLALAPANAGTVFAVTLPACDAPDADIPAEPTALQGSRGRVLVVDDEADVAETLCDMLERAGLQPEVALGGRAAQTALAHGSFDLVISDVRMPEVDGPALHGWITRHRPDLARSVAFVTGDTLSERVSEFLARVDCPVLEKPFAREALEEVIDRMMSR